MMFKYRNYKLFKIWKVLLQNQKLVKPVTLPKTNFKGVPDVKLYTIVESIARKKTGLHIK